MENNEELKETMEPAPEKQDETIIPPIPLSRLRHITKKMKHFDDETPLSFEFIMTAFFPTVYNNIKAQLNQQYTLGYIQGCEDTKKGVNNEVEGTC